MPKKLIAVLIVVAALLFIGAMIYNGVESNRANKELRRQIRLDDKANKAFQSTP